jgi:hypothetical protein
VSRTYRFRDGELPANLEQDLFAVLCPGHDRPVEVWRHERYRHRLELDCSSCGRFHRDVLRNRQLVPEPALVAELARRGWPARVARRRVRSVRLGWLRRHDPAELGRCTRGHVRTHVRTRIAAERWDDIDPERKDRGWCKC